MNQGEIKKKAKEYLNNKYKITTWNVADATTPEMEVMKYSDYLTIVDDIMVFMEQALESQKEEIISKLKKIEKERWSDAEHCTCLAYAIDKLKKKSST